MAGYTYTHIHTYIMTAAVQTSRQLSGSFFIFVSVCCCLHHRPAWERARVRRFCFRLYDIALYFLSELALGANNEPTDSIIMHARDLLGVHLIANSAVQCSLLDLALALAATSTPTPHTFGQHGGSPCDFPSLPHPSPVSLPRELVPDVGPTQIFLLASGVSSTVF